MIVAASFRHPWIGLLAAVAIVVVAVVLAWRWRRPRRPPWRGEGAISNVGLAEGSPVFRRLRRRYRTLIGVEIAVLATIGVGSAVLAMGPLGEQSHELETRNRDVMLCLDVSGSMKELDKSILGTFADIAADLPGDRIGLTIWSGSAITVFPLTDDHDYVAAMLQHAVDEFEGGGREFVSGTELGGSSLIGDGLASCVMRFDRLGDERARSVVFATDNKSAGEPLVSLDDAAAFARDRDVRVYSVAPAKYMSYRETRDLEEAVRLTGGEYLSTEDVRVVDHVIERISELEATHLERPPDVVVDDRPAMWAAVAVAGVSVLGLVAWKLRR